MWFNQYFLPSDLHQALQLLEKYGTGARLIAGGTDLILALEEKKIPPVEVVVDITRIADLQKISITNDRVEIGTCVTLANLIRSETIQQSVPLLVDAARQVAGPQVRNLATLGGNVANASPAADMVPALLAYDARVRIAQRDGELRNVRLDHFLKGYRQVDLAPGEIVYSFYIDVPPSETCRVFRKVQPRRAMTIAILNLAMILQTESGVIREMRVAMGAVAPTAVRLGSVERALIGKPVQTAMSPEVYAGIEDDVKPIDDFRASRHYRLRVARDLLQEQVLAILGLAEA